jgi:hypothetical protein
MKKIKMLFILLVISAMPLLSFAQEPPHPPGSGSPGTPAPGGGQTPVGTAPIGGGLELLLALSLVYGGKKVYDAKIANTPVND